MFNLNPLRAFELLDSLVAGKAISVVFDNVDKEEGEKLESKFVKYYSQSKFSANQNRFYTVIDTFQRNKLWQDFLTYLNGKNKSILFFKIENDNIVLSFENRQVLTIREANIDEMDFLES